MIRLDCKRYINSITGKRGILVFRGRDMFLRLEDGNEIGVEEGTPNWVAVKDPATFFNLCQILKDAPDNYELDSPVYGKLYLKDVTNRKIFLEGKTTLGEEFGIELDHNGRLNDKIGCNCVIFPKGKNTWFGFKPDWETEPAHKVFHTAQKVLVPIFIGNGRRWRIDLYSNYSKKVKRHITISGHILDDNYIFPYKGNEDMLDKEVKDYPF